MTVESLLHIFFSRRNLVLTKSEETPSHSELQGLVQGEHQTEEACYSRVTTP